MQTPNENGVYESETTEEMARRGRSYAAVQLCQCDDGLYRYALDFAYSHGGMCGPITASRLGFETYQEARQEGAEFLLERFPQPRESDPPSVQAELRELRAQIEEKVQQPTLF